MLQASALLLITALPPTGAAPSAPLPPAIRTTANTTPTAEARAETSDELARIPGSLVLACKGDLAPSVRSGFVDLAGGGSARIVALCPSSRDRIADWVEAGALEQQTLVIRKANDLANPKNLEPLLAADGLWLGNLPDKVLGAPLFRALLLNALDRGAVVGASGPSAHALTGTPGVDDGRLALVPRLEILGTPAGGDEDAAQRAAESIPARVVVAIPEGAAIAVHHGRRVALLGEGDVAFAIKREGGELVREQVLAANERRDSGDPLGYRIDLLSWIRSARDAERSPFPAEEPGEARLASGALILQGGGGVTDATWDRFIELAGGPDARFVCIPSAGEMDDDSEPRSYSARELEDRDCTSVSILHIADRRRAARDPRILDALASADAVWIDGGRTYRFMDRFEESSAATGILGVLDRGGVVGGSSAGCQVLGEFLVRGNPKTNSEMTDRGYRRALGALPGVVLDAHFIERNRHGQLASLVERLPMLLGLGVDAESALLVRGSVAEVLGDGGVVVYDRRHGEVPPDAGQLLEPGTRFDLVRGIIVD